MTSPSRKREVRELMKLTGWSYQFILASIKAFGYDNLTVIIDGLGPSPGREKLEEARQALRMAREVE